MASILIIDENPFMEEKVVSALLNEAHRISGVSEPDAVMEVFTGSRWDLILMDPLMDGIERWDIFQQLKMHNPSVPVVITSFYTFVLNDPHFHDSDGFVQKDWEDHNLKREILKALSTAECFQAIDFLDGCGRRRGKGPELGKYDADSGGGQGRGDSPFV